MVLDIGSNGANNTALVEIRALVVIVIIIYIDFDGQLLCTFLVKLLKYRRALWRLSTPHNISQYRLPYAFCKCE